MAKEYKTISFKADKYTVERIEALKRYYADLWNAEPEDFSTTEIILWALGSNYYDLTPEGEKERYNNIRTMHPEYSEEEAWRFFEATK